MPKWAHILVWSGVAVVVIGSYLWLFGVQTGLALIMRYKTRGIPEASMTPVALKDESVSNMPHRKLSYFGYEFEIPWDDVDEQKDKTSGTIHVSAFRSGNAFWFSTFPPKSFLDEIMKTSHLDEATVRRAYGDEVFQSDFAFYQTMLQVTPRQINAFMPQRQATTNATLLLIKVIAIPKADSGMFSIRTPNFQGFQFGNPQSRPYRITDELYADDGGINLIFFQKPGGPAQNLPQAEINRIIQSVHRVPESTPAASQ